MWNPRGSYVGLLEDLGCNRCNRGPNLGRAETTRILAEIRVLGPQTTRDTRPVTTGETGSGLVGSVCGRNHGSSRGSLVLLLPFLVGVVVRNLHLGEPDLIEGL